MRSSTGCLNNPKPADIRREANSGYMYAEASFQVILNLFREFGGYPCDNIEK
jgi:hypothetical protein